jgi:hypothetical protein
MIYMPAAITVPQKNRELVMHLGIDGLWHRWMMALGTVRARIVEARMKRSWRMTKDVLWHGGVWEAVDGFGLESNMELYERC